jgi:hypothetical protein
MNSLNCEIKGYKIFLELNTFWRAPFDSGLSDRIYLMSMSEDHMPSKGTLDTQALDDPFWGIHIWWVNPKIEF